MPNEIATENSMPQDRVGAGRRRFARALTMLLLAASLGACSSGLNFFAKEETAPDEAADRLYNEGLYLLNVRHRPERGGEEVRGGRPPASLFGMGAQIADHVVLCLLYGRRL